MSQTQEPSSSPPTSLCNAWESKWASQAGSSHGQGQPLSLLHCSTDSVLALLLSLIWVWNVNSSKKINFQLSLWQWREGGKRCDDAQKWPQEFRKHLVIPGWNEVAVNWGFESKLRKGKGGPRLGGYWESQSGVSTSGFVMNSHAKTLQQDTLI